MDIDYLIKDNPKELTTNKELIKYYLKKLLWKGIYRRNHSYTWLHRYGFIWKAK